MQESRHIDPYCLHLFLQLVKLEIADFPFSFLPPSSDSWLDTVQGHTQTFSLHAELTARITNAVGTPFSLFWHPESISVRARHLCFISWLIKWNMSDHTGGQPQGDSSLTHWHTQGNYWEWNSHVQAPFALQITLTAN